jgi:hypothetical protein
VADWLVVSKEFEEKWNYPSCIGAIDGKHIAIQNPNDSGSEFYNYKHFYSVLLLLMPITNLFMWMLELLDVLEMQGSLMLQS